MEHEVITERECEFLARSTNNTQAPFSALVLMKDSESYLGQVCLYQDEVRWRVNCHGVNDNGEPLYRVPVIGDLMGRLSRFRKAPKK